MHESMPVGFSVREHLDKYIPNLMASIEKEVYPNQAAEVLQFLEEQVLFLFLQKEMGSVETAVVTDILLKIEKKVAALTVLASLHQQKAYQEEMAQK